MSCLLVFLAFRQSAWFSLLLGWCSPPPDPQLYDWLFCTLNPKTADDRQVELFERQWLLTINA